MVQTNQTTTQANHTYATAGTYQIRISGNGSFFPTMLGQNNAYSRTIISVDQRGNNQWTNISQMFRYAKDLNIKAKDEPNLSNVTNMSYMFADTTNLTGNFADWNANNVVNMSYMFYNATNFSRPIGTWNTSKVTDMSYMFNNATAFDQPINTWTG